MSHIFVRPATQDELNDCQSWDLWESGDAKTFEYKYEQDVQFVVQSGDAVILTQCDMKVTISQGSFVYITQGLEGYWQISSPIRNRYIYL